MAHEGMTCPVDKTPLVMSERQGIEIDYCPTCRGVWLDRGELDKIIERSAAFDEPYEYAKKHYPEGKHVPKKKPKSFLKDLLEFD
jgi:Zn-finger nucleic acid-binding protein